jgi:hypothetical protein
MKLVSFHEEQELIKKKVKLHLKHDQLSDSLVGALTSCMESHSCDLW